MFSKILSVIGIVGKFLNKLFSRQKEKRKRNKQYSDKLSERLKRKFPWVLIICIVFLSSCSKPYITQPIGLSKKHFRQMEVDGRKGWWVSPYGMQLIVTTELFRRDMERWGYDVKSPEFFEKESEE